jgi:hypothetical protein
VKSGYRPGPAAEVAGQAGVPCRMVVPAPDGVSEAGRHLHGHAGGRRRLEGPEMHLHLFGVRAVGEGSVGSFHPGADSTNVPVDIKWGRS